MLLPRPINFARCVFAFGQPQFAEAVACPNIFRALDNGLGQVRRDEHDPGRCTEDDVARQYRAARDSNRDVNTCQCGIQNKPLDRLPRQKMAQFGISLMP